MTEQRFANATVYTDGVFKKMDLFIGDGRIVSLSPSVSPMNSFDGPSIDCSGLTILPGFVDVHVHLREPGFSYKETIESGTRAAARGGYTTVCTMPNLKPVPDSLEHLAIQQRFIRDNAVIHVLPYAAITSDQKGKTLSDFEALAPHVVGFTDDGWGVADEKVMQQAMERAAALGKPIVAHAEDLTLTNQGVIHDGSYAHRHHHRGNPSESEWVQVERDIKLAAATGVQYHVCHVSTKESARLIRSAQAQGLTVTGETAPHYLVLTDEDLRDEGRFRMNPPIRTGADREALRLALADGTLVAIATDHAPHADEEKNGGLDKSLNGIVGLETAFPVLYTTLVLPGILPLERLIEALSTGPVDALHLKSVKEAKKTQGIARGIAVGEVADFAVWDLNACETVDPKRFLSKGRATPFAGWTVRGRCLLTMVGGKAVYQHPASALPKIEE